MLDLKSFRSVARDTALEGKVKELFQKYDVNKDGCISEEAGRTKPRGFLKSLLAGALGGAEAVVPQPDEG